MDYGLGDKTYEGRQNQIPTLKTPEIEAWEFQYPGSDTELTVTIPEFTCVCPKTGLPDFATLTIRYVPDKLCLELKSLKEYILFFREVGIFHEHVVNKMLTDCTQACQPRLMVVEGIFNARGGIQTTAIARYAAKNSAQPTLNATGAAGSIAGSASSRLSSIST